MYNYRRTAQCLLLSLSLLLLGAGPSSQGAPPPLTGILAAMDSEAAPLLQRISGKQTQKFMGIEFITGHLEGHSVVLAVTGVGKVNAAMTTMLLLDHFHPGQVLFTGIAGGLNADLEPGDVVIAAKVAHHDLGNITADGLKPFGARNPVDKERNPVFFPCDAVLVDLARSVCERTPLQATTDCIRPAKTICGVIVSGDTFITVKEKAKALRTQFGADAVEMEGAAVAQVCYQQKTPFLILRSLSDSANEKANADLEKNFRIAAENSARVLTSLVAALNTAQATQPAEAAGP
jgi:adenosylhomocysteine nucleosidase